MAPLITHLSDSKSHPINLLEEITISKNWIFERPIEDEIYIEVPTKYSNLIIQVNWLKNKTRIEIRSFFYNKMDFSDNVEIYKLLNLIGIPDCFFFAALRRDTFAFGLGFFFFKKPKNISTKS